MAWCAVLLACALARPVQAQASPIAEALFRAGRQASARGDHATACAKYRESQRIEKASGTLLNIAVCEEALGELASAWSHYQAAVHAFDATDRRRELARERLSALELRLPRLSVVLAQGAAGTTRVEIDGVRLAEASFGVPIPRDPGTYALHVLAEGHAPRRYEVTLAEAEQRTLLVEPGAALEAAPPLTARERRQPRAPIAAPALATKASPRPREGSALTTTGYAALGTGAAALIASSITFALAIDRKAVVDAHCPGRACDDTGLGAAGEGRTFVTLSLASLAAGLALSALGTAALWTAPDEAARARSEAPGAAF